MKEMSKEELQSINGGISLLAAAGLVAAGVRKNRWRINYRSTC